MPTTFAADPLVVVGAGAAGLMAAIFAAEPGGRVLLLERTPDGGRKILISGGGRCNVLPSVLAPERFVTDSSPHLLRRMLGSWPQEGQRAFFERELGLPLALESETGKLFPVSNRARDVRDRLVARARARGVEIRGNAQVTGLEREGGRFRLILPDGEALFAARVIIAAGGLSVPATGSAGFGLDVARRFGHTVHQTYPALTPLLAEPPVHAGLAGVSLTATLTAAIGRRRVQATGGFLFTHRGYSGPAVLDLSHVAVRSRLAGGPRQPITVQWGDLPATAWDALLRERSAAGVLGVLREQLPLRLAERLLEEAGVDPRQQLAQLRRESRRDLVERLTAYPLPWSGDEGYKKAEVTGGGLALNELDPATLESRRVPGLFFAGEVLDAFGPIGGHNFAWAWATGRLAGLGAAKRTGRAS
jgi:predicted Rossmann fold flavoprotein